MRILITGGLGFIGSNLLELLISKPKIKQIIIVDNQSKCSLEYIDTICKYKYFSKSNDYTVSRSKVVVINTDISNYQFSLIIIEQLEKLLNKKLKIQKTNIVKKFDRKNSNNPMDYNLFLRSLKKYLIYCVKKY